MAGTRIAIIGFGFSGLMVTANLVKNAKPGTTLYLIAPRLDGRGLAYGTTDTQHLLNVPAARMSAFEDDKDHLRTWLTGSEGVAAKQQLGLTAAYGAADFIPRALYGLYLSSIWQQAQQDASARHCLLKLVETTATRIRTEGELAILTARGDAIAVDRILLATGNETKPVAIKGKPSAALIQNPWAEGALAGAAEWPEPVMLVGAGLTAVDMVLSLRARGYQGNIIATSRGGKWPMPHAASSAACILNEHELTAQKTPTQMLKLLRTKITALGEWRPVIDALRPHTQKLWKAWPLAEQNRFIARLLSRWNIHRHRMAPEISAVIVKETMAGTLTLYTCKKMDLAVAENSITVTLQTNGETQTLTPSRILNCTGGELQLVRSANPLLKQALADHVIEPHANGLGLAVDQHYRVWGEAYPNLYAIGSLMTGEWLETTAVPELRGQAQKIAAALASD